METLREKKMLTVKEFSQLYGMKEGKVRELTHIKGFPCIRIGVVYHIIASEVDQWFKRNIGRQFSESEGRRR